MRLSEVTVGATLALPIGDGSSPARASQAVKVTVLRIDRERGKTDRTRSIVRVRTVGTPTGQPVHVYGVGRLLVGGEAWVAPSALGGPWSDAEANETSTSAIERVVDARRSELQSAVDTFAARVGVDWHWAPDTTAETCSFHRPDASAAEIAQILRTLHQGVDVHLGWNSIREDKILWRLLEVVCPERPKPTLSFAVVDGSFATVAAAIDKAVRALNHERDNACLAIASARPTVLTADRRGLTFNKSVSREGALEVLDAISNARIMGFHATLTLDQLAEMFDGQ